MIDTKLLNEKIDNSGLSTSAIIEKLGISSNSYHKKLRNEEPFKASEVFILCDLLQITSGREKCNIFYPESLLNSKY